MEDENVAASDNLVTEFVTYEDFLDSQITALDLYYLEVSFINIIILNYDGNDENLVSSRNNSIIIKILITNLQKYELLKVW